MFARITGHDSETYFGTVTIENDTVSFSMRQDAEYGEYKLRKYGKAERPAGHICEVPIPYSFVDHADEVAQAIQEAVKSSVYNYANDRHGIYAKRNSDFSYILARDPANPVTQDTSLPFDLLNSTLDFVIASEDYCVSNYEMAFDLYDFYTGRLYRITFLDCEDYMNGVPITIYGHVPDDEEQERLIEFDHDLFPDKECFRVVE